MPIIWPSPVMTISPSSPSLRTFFFPTFPTETMSRYYRVRLDKRIRKLEGSFPKSNGSYFVTAEQSAHVGRHQYGALRKSLLGLLSRLRRLSLFLRGSLCQPNLWLSMPLLCLLV